MINGILNSNGTSPVVYVPAYRKSTVHALEIGLGLGNILQIWIIPYMEIKYFHPLIYYLQNYFLIKIPPPPLQKKIPPTHFHSQQRSCFQWLYIWINETQMTFLDTVEMGLITDMQTYKSLNLVQHLFHKTLHCTL